jgi:hypothetical protein
MIWLDQPQAQAAAAAAAAAAFSQVLVKPEMVTGPGSGLEMFCDAQCFTR